jgi:ComF family protein
MSSLFSYQNSVVQKSITLAKYRGAFRALLPFVLVIPQFIFEKAGDAEKPLVLVPIPSTKKSFRKRGFSHTLFLARALARAYPNNFVVEDILVRAKHTKKQTECATRAERTSNMQNAFTARGAISSRAGYVLIDDVITTGATMAAAQSALTKAGARIVFPVSLAYQELT